MEATIIIVDMNQVMLSNLLMQLGNHTNAQLEENMVRHMILNSLRSYRTKFTNEYGELVIACDNTNYWRKMNFPFYKANRKKNIEKSELNWKQIFECMNKIRQELKDYFPYKVIDVESAEADDIIATLCDYRDPLKNFETETILILSGDKDFIQLQTRPHVKQYDPTRKKWVVHQDPVRYLQEHIIKGDSGDGIPNVLSADNCLAIGERQKVMTKKRLEELIELSLDGKFDHPNFKNFWRNKALIDLSFVPTEIQHKIIESYEAQRDKNRSKLMAYFMDKKLKNLMENISDF